MIAGSLNTIMLGQIASGGGGGFLLDAYTDSNRAFSLRKLISTATVAIRVQRSSDLAEQDIGFVGEDLDTSSLLSFVGSSNGSVVTWYDQVGTQHHAGIAGKLPIIVNAGTLIADGGKPCIAPSVNSSGFERATSAALNQPFACCGVFKGGAGFVSDAVFSTFSFFSRLDGYSNFDAGLRVSGVTQSAKHNFFANLNGASSSNAVDSLTPVTGSGGTANIPTSGTRMMVDMYNNTSTLASRYMEVIFFSGDKISNRSGIMANQKAYWGTP